jgi:hypothetical protein
VKKFLFLFFMMVGSVYADTTGNLIGGTWNNVTNGTHPNDCCTGGPGPLYDSNTNTIHFSYGLTAVHQVQAINQALSGSGIQINGWNWGYDLRNMDGVAGNQNRTTDTINVTSFITNSAGQIVQQSDQYYNTQFDWTRFSGTVNLNTNLGLADAGSLGIQFVANDGGYWAGYYGPQVRDVSLSANYTVDQCAVNPQSSPTCPGFKTYYNMSDDGYARVDLPFAFPFYGQLFTTSYMYTNGVVGFLDNNWGFCCDGTDLNQQISQPNSPWNYAIYALNTDLYPGANSEFYTQQTDNGTGLKYSWVNVPEIGTDLNNTFHVQIKDSGYIGITYDQVNLNSYRNPLIGIAGDISQGQYSVTYYGQASALPNLNGTTNVYTGTELTDICAIDPLYSTSCPGYATAYYNQQCSLNPLYDTTCPGYASAYYTQQCSLNPLYDVACPGYASAYLTYQCSLDSLYSTSCPGYAQAYLNQQCSLNPLYDSTCAGYQTATTECSLNPLSHTYCPSYQTAVTDCSTNGLLHSYCPTYALEQQLCSTDPLSNTLCTGYQTATTACAANPLTGSYCPNYQTATNSCAVNTLNHSYCPGYDTALNTCSTNPLSNTLCSGYAEASTQCSSNQLLYTYCPAYTTTLASCATNPQSNNLCPGYSATPTTVADTTTVTEPAPSLSSDGTVTTKVSSTGNSTVDSVINTTATSTTSPTATVQLTTKPTETATPVQVAAVEQAQEVKKDDMVSETTTQDNASGNQTTAKKDESSSSSESGGKKSARQEIAERRAEVAKRAAVEAGKNASEDMGSAPTMEAQVKVQNVVIQAMGFTPGFDAYKFVLPDAVGYKPFAIYKNQKTVDNARMMRGLTGASDKLHDQMVMEQYQ